MRLLLLGAVLGALGASCLVPREAFACGGCFIPPVQDAEHGTVVTSHRMALAISPTQTTLWDQVRYSGSPKEFAWVLPVKPGARVEVATDAFFDVLEAATETLISAPLLTCTGTPGLFGCSVAPVSPLAGSFGCAADAAGGGPAGLTPAPVTVVSHGSAGPYEAVILHGSEPGALSNWLASHDYQVPSDVSPLIDAYVAEGFDFAALRLIPSAEVTQMRPVRVVMPGAVPTLPLRMVAAGTGAKTAITLFVIGEGRYTTDTFREVSIPEPILYWDYQASRSNYSVVRDQILGVGDVFLTTYAERGPFFGRVDNAVSHLPLTYQTTNKWISTTVADAYVQQALVDGDTSSTDCADAFDGLDEDTRRVVLPCKKDGTCKPIDASSEIDGRKLECDPPLGSDLPLDDLAQALVGMHPRDVWITRLEGNLSRNALAHDLEVVPAKSQVAVASAIEPSIGINPPATCELKSEAPAPFVKPRPPTPPFDSRPLVAVTLGALAIVLVVRRRARLGRRFGAPEVRA